MIISDSFMEKDVVQQAVNAFVQAVCDLAKVGKELELNFDFAVIKIKNRNLFYYFK